MPSKERFRGISEAIINRRLGDYLKELQLSEGRGTGIPTIQDELRRNGLVLLLLRLTKKRVTS